MEHYDNVKQRMINRLTDYYLDCMNDNARNYLRGVINKKGYDVLHEYYLKQLKELHK